MDDEKIIELYFSRSEDALKETAAKYSAYLSRIALNILNSREDSEECVNDTYLKAWNTIPPHLPAKLSYYLGKITRELSIDRLRRRMSKKRSTSEYDLSLDELSECITDRANTENLADERLLAQVISDFLRQCSEDARDIFVCRYYFCDSVKSIAGWFGISESKVKSSLYHTRQKLKERLESEGYSI